MKIKFVKNYKSIENFDEKEINNFSIFTGFNGSGKTHILEGIHNGAIQINNIDRNKISYFNFSNFLLQNQPAANATAISQLKKQAWGILEKRKNHFIQYDNNIKNFVTQTEEGCLYHVDTEHIKENQETNYHNSVDQVSNFIQAQSKGNPKQFSLLKSAFYNTDKPLSEITEDDFFELSSFDYLDYHLLNNLSEVFIEHQKKVALAHMSIETGGLGLSDDKIDQLKQHSPWNLINSIFEQFKLSHRVNYPIFSAGDLIKQPDLTFQVDLTVNGKKIQFSDLSSGEKILCALAITVFQDTKSDFPGLLLLDEIDATLHPSMIQETITVIENIFVKNGSKVILATHSPTTIAHAPKGSIYEVKKGTVTDKIVEIDKTRALNILTAGFLTFEEGIGLLQKPKPQIYLEGTTDIDYWNKAFELFGDDFKNLKDNIEIIDGNGGESKRTYTNLLKVPDNYILSEHIFVFDCDEQKQEKHDDKLSFIKNDKNEGSLVEDGIENLFNEEFLKRAYNHKNDFFKVISETDRGNTTIKYKVHPDEKRNLCNWICDNSTVEDFKNFKPIFKKVVYILK